MEIEITMTNTIIKLRSLRMKAKQIYTLLILTASCLLLPQSTVFGSKLCRATLDCPPDYNKDTVTVGYDVAMLSEMFEHCAPDSIKEGIIDTITDTISLFIIIDHSASMSVMDPASNRYKVACATIDSIYKHSPASEIGIAVFSNKLLHSYQTDTIFKQLDSSKVHGWNDSYLPLKRLDTQIGGLSAVEKLKWAIQISDTVLDPGQNKKLVNAEYGTSGRGAYNGGTDISLAFEAAKEAFLSATYAKKRQFIVFLSDGVHQLIDTARQSHARDYIAGENIPTTYTAFFINQGQPIPDQMDTMTWNIQKNGYSENNYSSKVWGTQAQEQKFFQLLLNNIIGDALKVFHSTPISMTINGVTTKTFDDTFAFYQTPFVPLSAQGPTKMDVSYTWRWNAPVNKEVTREYTIFIAHTQSNQPDLESVDCWNQGRIAYFYANSQLFHAGASHDTVNVRFYPPDSGNFPPIGNTIDLEIQNADASDKILVTLNKHLLGTYYTTTFFRQYASVNPNDGILQNSNTDSIRAIYRNPVIPIDTLRYAIDVLPSLDLSVKRACYLDRNANGHPDTVGVVQGGGLVLSTDDCAVVQPFISFKTERGIVADLVQPASFGFTIGVNDALSKTPNTGLYNDERLAIICNSITLPSGTVFPPTDLQIIDSMAPVIVKASYYDFVNKYKNDTLIVIFSEPLKTTSHIEPFLFNRLPVIASYKLKLALARLEGNTAVFSVINLTGQQTPQPGDSIWINEAANLSDTLENRQNNPKNIRRKLEYFLIMSLETATYLDTSSSPDGFIDVINVISDTVPDKEMLDSILKSLHLPDYQNFIITDIVPTDSGFLIIVTQKDKTTPVTDIDPLKDSLWVDSTGSLTSWLIYNSQIPIKDGVAPVLVKAIFMPKYLKHAKDTTIKDTLEITFSEPVKPPPYQINKPFRFAYLSGGQPYTMTLDPLRSSTDNRVKIFLVLHTEKPFPENGDPVWINPAAKIADLVGNIQDNEKNRPVPLIVKPYHFDIEVIVGPNPGDFSQLITIDNISANGILIKVDVIGGWSSTNTMEAQFKIFDVVGNTVAESPGTPSSDKKYFFFIWNGSNKNGRKIVDGSYLAYIVVKNSSGIKRSKRAYVGVKRHQ